MADGRTMRGAISSLKHGGSVQFSAKGGAPVTVTYHERQSHGDSGARVPGAYNGTFTVAYPNGRTTTHEHGPFAKTEAAAKRGASRDSKLWTASRVNDEVTAHLHAAQMGFRDRRGE